ncbi:MAG: tetratricopeptide repeat protein [Bacteroidetes bacterium]|nr:tetratricopeptide repeat protein [Bacteroidota bacterium]
MKIKKPLRTILILFFIIINNTLIYADISKIDSLKKSLYNIKEEKQFDIFIQLSRNYRNNSFKKSFFYAHQALKNSQKFNNKENEIKAFRNLGATFKSEGKLESTIKQFQKALAIAKKHDNQSQISVIYNEIGDTYLSFKKYKKAIESYNKTLDICKTDSLKIKSYIKLYQIYQDQDIIKSKTYILKLDSITSKIKNKKFRAEYYLISGNYYNVVMVDYKKAIKNYTLAINIYHENNMVLNEALLSNNIGTVYEKMSDYGKAMKYFMNSLKISKKLSNSVQLGKAYLNVGLIHYRTRNYKKAAEFYNKSLEIKKNLNDLKGMALIYNNFAILYYYQENFDKTKEYFRKAYDIYLESGNLRKQVMALGNLGELAFSLNDNNTALKYYNKSLAIYKTLKDKEGISYILLKLGEIELSEKNYEKAEIYLHRTLEISQSINSKKYIESSYSLLHQLNKEQKRYEKALYYHEKFLSIHDSIYNEASNKQLAEIQTKYETHEKQTEIELLSKDKALKEVEIKKQKYIKNGLILGSIIILLFAFLTYNRFLIKKRSNKLLTEQKNKILYKNEELNQQKEEILSQRDLIEDKNKNLENAFNIIKHKNKNITDSINYAQKIQNALLPPEHYLNNILNDYFVLFKPKDIVSGDFYWVRQHNQKIIVAAADCTGHGVPGAFMSILGTTFLNEINHLNTEIEANEILNILSHDLKKTLHQTDENHETRDGMDIALYIIDTEKQTLQFSGAYNPLYLIRNKKLCQYKADKMPIGLSHKKEKPFTKHEINLKKEDSIYIFSDGYIDQFDKNNKEKFKTKRFQELLIRINEIPMSQQKNVLDNIIEKWRGDVEQIDDILVFGVKI